MSLYRVHAPSNPWGVRPGGALLAGGCIVRPGGGETIDQLLADARKLLDRIEDEVRRLATEVFELRTTGRVAGVLVFGPLGLLIDDFAGLNARATTYEGVIEQLERFVVDVFNRVEAKALKGDAAAALRLRDSTARILGAAEVSSPIEDLRDDVKATLADAFRDLKAILGAIDTLTKVVVVGMVVNFLSKFVGPRR